MTVLDMCLYLGELLNDPTNASTGEGQRFSAAMKLRSLNRSQEKFCSMVVNEALMNLERTKAITSISSSGYNLDNLDAAQKYFRYVNSKNTTDNVFITRINTGEVGEMDNSLFNGTADDPKCYLFQSKFYVVPSGKDVQLWYIKKPQTLVVSGAGSGEVETCEINNMFHGTVVRMADAELKSVSKEYTNSAALIEATTQEVLAINANYTALEKSNE